MKTTPKSKHITWESLACSRAEELESVYQKLNAITAALGDLHPKLCVVERVRLLRKEWQANKPLPVPSPSSSSVAGRIAVLESQVAFLQRQVNGLLALRSEHTPVPAYQPFNPAPINPYPAWTAGGPTCQTQPL